MTKTLAALFVSTWIVGACGGSGVKPNVSANAVSALQDCAADPSSVNKNPNAFKYEDIAGQDFFMVGDDDDTGLNPVRVKMGEDCVLRAKPGFSNFGNFPAIVAKWQYTADGAIRIDDWSDQFSLIQTTSAAHEICWDSFSTCEGEGQFRSEGGVRRLFFNEADARTYFENL